jgi:hypothetical protein
MNTVNLTVGFRCIIIDTISSFDSLRTTLFEQHAIRAAHAHCSWMEYFRGKLYNVLILGRNSQEQMSKGLMSILRNSKLSSCLNVSVWICAHALLHEVVRFQIPSSKFQVAT